MSIKQFLELEPRKIVIFVFISILILLIPVYPCEIEIHGVESLPALGLYPGTKLVPIYMGILSSIMREDILSYQECGLSDEIWWISCKCHFSFLLPFSLIVIVIPYLLSCIIVWIYKKVKKK